MSRCLRMIRVEVRFPTSAVRAGISSIQIAGASGKWTDAAEIELPVWTPATTEAFATYGEIDQGRHRPGCQSPFGRGDRIWRTRDHDLFNRAQALTDAVLYLVSYRFECAEQLSSQVLAVAALRDVLTAFGSQGPAPQPPRWNRRSRATSNAFRAYRTATEDSRSGSAGDESWPYISISRRSRASAREGETI